MGTTTTPQPPSQKFSIFRRFSRRPSVGQVSNNDAYNSVVRSPNRLRRPSLDASPPLSPASSRNDSLFDVKRSPSPHLTKDKTYRKDRTISYTQRIEIPQIVRERLSRESSSSSTKTASSTASNRVEANAIATTPFPNTPQSRIQVAKWDLYIPPADVHALYMGFLPQEMCDKWFIYSEGPDPMGKLKVHFHRSWTGVKMAELFVVIDTKGEGAGKVVGLKWNAGDNVGSGRMRPEEAKYLIRSTVRCVLGVSLEGGD